MTLALATFDVGSPIGVLRCVATDDGLALVELPGGRDRARRERLLTASARVRAAPRHPAAAELRDWFRGRVTDFATPVDLRWVSDFDRAVLAQLLAIPFGGRATYGEVATAIGRPGAARAVGGAVGRNPVPIVVPCHRVVARAGLGGFGGGLETKRVLLALEAQRSSQRRSRNARA